ncbi:MAG: TPM domain-containing protein [Usitatibacter sp.]
MQFAIAAACLLAVALPAAPADRHVYDRAGVLPRGDIPRFEQYMRWIQRESDVDVRFVFVPGLGGRSIEQAAVDTVAEMKIGGKTGQQRGLLLLFDTQGGRLKVEVGYGLEGHFPDGFVSYLVRDHAKAFFESGDLSVGLRLLLRLLQHRIREAVLGMDFDPRVLKAIETSHLSGGAGITSTMPSRNPKQSRPAARMPKEERARYRAGSSPAETYAAYLAWLARPEHDPDVDLFTPPSRAYLFRLPLTPAYRQFILLGEYGKTHRIVQRESLALLIFTGTPFVSPHFFVKDGDVWRMDMEAEVRDTVERVGGAYTWDYRGQNDAYTQAFADLLTMIQGYRRFKDGDNRALSIRGDKR